MWVMREKLREAIRQGTTLAAVTLAASCAGRSAHESGGNAGTGGSAATGAPVAAGTSAAGGNATAGGAGSSAGGRETSAGGATMGGRGGERPSAGAPGEAGSTGGDGTVEHDGGTMQPGLEPYPIGLIGSKGPSYDGGFHGQCSFDAYCYTPEGGSDCAPSTDPTLRTLLPGFPPGSGSCTCSVEDMQEVTGPFAPNPNDEPTASGSCCYIVGRISCEGRPFVIDGAPRVAPLVMRSDWGA